MISLRPMFSMVAILLSQLLFSDQASASCEKDLKNSYVAETANVSSWQIFAQKITSTVRVGPPPLLRGIEMPNFIWARGGGSGFSRWGAMQILTNGTERIFIYLRPSAEFTGMGKRHCDILRQLYPALKVDFSDQEIEFSIRAPDLLPGESFVKTVRSLIHTILRDPKGMLQHPDA